MAVYFVNTEYIKENTQLNGSVEDTYLRPAVKVAQDLRIVPHLGHSLRDKLIADISGDTVAGAYQTLLRDYIRPALAWWTVFEYLPDAMTKIDNSGLVQRLSDDASPVTSVEYNRLRQNAEDKAEHYTNLMIEYLCENTSSFPELRDNTGEQRAPVWMRSGRGALSISNGHNTSRTHIPRNWIYGD